MSSETSQDSPEQHRLIDHLMGSKCAVGPLLGRSLIDLYASGEFTSYFVDSSNHEEPEGETSAMAWRFIVMDEDYNLSSHILSIVSQERNERLINFMRQATLDLKQVEGRAKLYTDRYMATAIDTASNLGLQTVAAMHVSENSLTHEHVTEVTYPEIYQEIGQVDVQSQLAGTEAGKVFKRSWGVALGTNFLKQTTFTSETVFENI